MCIRIKNRIDKQWSKFYHFILGNQHNPSYSSTYPFYYAHAEVENFEK